MSHHSYSYRFCKPESHHHQQKQWSFCMDNAYAVWITDHLQSSWNHKGGYDVIGSDKDDCITGSACDDNLYGAGGNDTIYGGKGNDVIDGGKGADHMHGGKGDDSYYVDDACDVVVEKDCEGVDTVYTSIDYTAPDHVENVTAIGECAINLTGNCLDNVLTGNQANNILKGEAGDDTLYGKGGNDTLYGGDGNDTLYGDAGCDILYGDCGEDVLFGGEGADRLDGGLGNDLLNGGAGADVYVFAAGYGHDVIEDCGDVCETDVLNLKDGIHLENLVFSEDCGNLVITACDRPDDSITIKDWFSGAEKQIEQFEFDCTCVTVSNSTINQAFEDACGAAVSGSTLAAMVQEQCNQAQVQAQVALA